MDAKIIEEVQTRYILHWNYRGLTCLPPEVIQFGAHVEEIYLKENGIQALPENVHQILPKLREIYLYGNSLQKLPQSIGGFEQLQVLDLSHNQLTNLPKAIGQITSLKTLDFSHNEIYELPDEIGNLLNLTALIGVSNHISELPVTIKNLSNLKSLHLNGNKLKQIRAEVCKCTSLMDLYLERNQLTEIPEELSQLHYLKHINVSHNDLRQLPFLPFISEAKVTFDDNPGLSQVPFIFGCQQNQLKSWIRLNSAIQSDDNAPWKFTVRGCFKTNPNKPVDKIKIKNSDKTPASLLEITLRVVYGNCFGPQVTRRNVNEFKRSPRLTSSFGKWLLFKDEVVLLPRPLMNLLKKGPRAFCSWCTKALFREAVIKELPIHIMVRNPESEEDYHNQIQPTTIMHFCGNTCSTQSYKILWKMLA